MEKLFENISSVTANRILTIWEAINEPAFYPDISRLDYAVQQTILRMAPLNPLYFGSTVLRLYGLTERQPNDIDVLCSNTDAITKLISSGLFIKVADGGIDYYGNRREYVYKCKLSGITVQFVLGTCVDFIYTRNMKITSIYNVVKQVYECSLMPEERHIKHRVRMREIFTILIKKGAS